MAKLKPGALVIKRGNPTWGYEEFVCHPNGDFASGPTGGYQRAAMKNGDRATIVCRDPHTWGHVVLYHYRLGLNIRTYLTGAWMQAKGDG